MASPSRTSKTCPDCGADKALDEFPPARRRTDGRGTYCRACMSLRSQASRAKKRDAEGRPVQKRQAVPPNHRRCPHCSGVKPLDEFPRNRSGRGGYGAYCKPCHNERGRANREALHGSTRNYHLKARYGITAAQYDAVLAAQGGLCAVCRERPAEHVDHDHRFGHVRGLLCSCCNQGLGNFRDDLAHLAAAVDYLERTTWHRRETSTGVYQLTSPRPAAAASPSSSALQRLISSRRG